MGFGLRELKLLSYAIREVSAENKISDELAVQKFFGDIEKNYDNKLGYGTKLVGLKSGIEGLKSGIDKQNKELSAVQNVLASKNMEARALDELTLSGFDVAQILNLALALQSNISNKESIEADLKKYGTLKQLIEGLNQEVRELENRKKPMEAERSRLNLLTDEVERRFPVGTR